MIPRAPPAHLPGVLLFSSDPPAAMNIIISTSVRRSAIVPTTLFCSAAFFAASSAYLLPSFCKTHSRRSYRTTNPMFAKNYLLKYDYVPDILERRDPHRPGHLDLANQLIAQGKCLHGGPVSSPGMTVPSGALFVFTDVDSANLFAKEDPYMKAGLVTGYSVQEWNVILQKDTSL